MATGKLIRLKRVIDEDSGTSLICALDHGMTSPVFLTPLADIARRTAETVAGGANVIMMSKGMIRQAVASYRKTTSLAMLLSASAHPGEHPSIAAVAEVAEALRQGADAVVPYVALDGDGELAMIERLAAVGEACDRLGMPFIAEAEYPTTYSSLESLESAFGVDYLLRNVRLCAELGADIVKTNWSGSEETFRGLVEATSGIPVVLAGGSKIADEELLGRQEAAMRAGAIGCSVGRNIFMHDDPEGITRALRRVIVDRWSAEQALAERARPGVGAAG
jgi:DhnA family fructose-bisphosphate aldolase class Ia